MDADFIAVMLTQDMDGLLDNRIFEQVIERIDHNKFAQVAGKLYQASGKTSGDALENVETAQQAYQHLMNTEKGVELRQEIEEKQAREKEERDKRIQEINGKINEILNQYEAKLLSEDRAGDLPELLDGLNAEGETATVEAIIDRLTIMVHREDPDIRNTASRSLADVLDRLSPQQRNDVLIRHTDRLIKWMKLENTGSDTFRRICMLHKDLVQSRIRNYQFSENAPLLETFRLISSHQIKQNDQTRSAVSEAIRDILSPDILSILMDEFRTDQQNKRNEAGKTLVMMAEQSVGPLLDLLMESDVSSERILILNLIPDMGNAAVPAIIARMNESAPWYCLRNLARLLGRTGNEEHAKTVLAPLLSYGDLRVQKEAFKSISGIGGASKGYIYLNALLTCDDQLKVNIVTALGSVRHRDAVKPLMDLFKSKTNLPEEMKIDLQEKICLALGNIGGSEALPFLKEVSKPSGIFSFKPYNPKVRAAAGRAVGMLSKS
jgi:HEAT repeat protein